MDSNRKIKVIAFNPSVKLKSIEYGKKKTIEQQNDMLMFLNAIYSIFITSETWGHIMHKKI